MSGGKSLEDLIKEHKEPEPHAPEPIQRVESEEEKKRREDRVKAMEARLSKKTKIDDRAVQAPKPSTNYPSSGGKNERVLEDRARALLNKKSQLEENISKKEEEEKSKQDRMRLEAEELKMQRTESQQERAKQVCVNFYLSFRS